MDYFKFRRIQDYLYFYLIRPGRKGIQEKNTHIQEFIKNVLSFSDASEIQKIVQLRKDYLCDNQLLEITDFGAGSQKINGTFRKVSDIARISGSSLKKCKLLYRIAATYKPEKIIELGTSLGFGAMSLSMGNEKSVIYTIEGSQVLYHKAKENFIRYKFHNIRPLCGSFDEVFPELLHTIQTADLFFIDGNHTYEATWRYYQLILKHIKPNSIIIFDDIRWSAGMFSAWQDICNDKHTKIAIDLLDLGVVFVSDIIKREYFRIYY